MADIRYFSDFNGSTIECDYVTAISNQEFAIRFPDVIGMRYDGYTKWVGRTNDSDIYTPITRKIEYKSQPSKHQCNAKCLNGKINGVCECSCGGKNHGHGSFTELVSRGQKSAV